MTIKQKLFVKKYLEIGNGTQAALSVYDTNNPNVAHSIAVNNLRSPTVIEEINKLLDRKGLSLEQVSESVGEVFKRGIETKVTGDNLLRAAEMVYKLHGAYPAQKSTHFRYEARQKLEEMSYQELVKLHQEKTKEIEEILKD